MRQNLERFLKALRGMDVPVSVAEAIDAHRTAALVGWSDRTLLRDALAVAVAKSEDEKARYFECFDAFFAAAGASRDPDRATAAETAGETLRAADADPDRPAGDLVRMLLDGDRAGVSAAMAAAAGEVDLSRLRLFTQRGVFMRRILDAMGIGDLETEIRSLRAAPDDPAATERADRLEDARERLIEESRDLVERNIALFADPASARLREEFLERMRLANIPPRDFERVRRIVRRMAKRLASRHARRRFNRKDGRLDPRRTIRSNIAHDGVPFRLAWRYTRVERPKVVAVCDVSGSVAATAQFLLLLLHSMREVMSDFRAFAFSSHLEEVDDLLGGRPFEEAAAGIMERIGFRPTDYGRTLVDLEEGYLDVIDRRTTVIVLGDGRNNRGDPRTASLERIFQRAKRVIWLNPEPRTFWGTGDSEMLRYLPWCHVARVCNTLRHLERAVDDLLAARA
ncbi:MAG: VWA domain-containing protein [Immundisolibacterales bacterium]|nr:VWA domain-containing protein [Immundisolibacterales bacterium]